MPPLHNFGLPIQRGSAPNIIYLDYSSASIIEEPTWELSIIIICSVSRYFDMQITFFPLQQQPFVILVEI